MRLGTQFGGRGFELTYTATEAAIPVHVHADYALAYYLQGLSQAYVQENDRCTEMRAGDLGIINPHEPHEDFETASEREYLTIYIKVDFFQELLGELGRPMQNLSLFTTPNIPSDGHVNRIMEGLRAELEHGAVGHRGVVFAKVALGATVVGAGARAP